MIGIALILATAAIAGTTLIAKYWNKVLSFLKKVSEKLSLRFSKNEKIMGVAVYIRRIGEKFQNRTKHYSKDEMMRWKETTVVYDMNEEVPEEYRQYTSEYNDYDITDELALQLKQA